MDQSPRRATTVGELRRLEIPGDLGGERIDVALSRLLGISRTKAADLISSGCVVVNGKVPRRSDRGTVGATIDIDLPDVVAPLPAAMQIAGDLRIVIDDPAFVVVDKPIGVAAHPSPGWTGPTVIGSLLATGTQVASLGPQERQGIVHRLDVGTSGLMVVAKTDLAYSSLKSQFKNRTVDKTYHALVQGHPDPTRGTIDAPIGRHPAHDYKFAVVTGGKPSVTHYELLEAFPYASLLKIELETGRTHQIRVHLAAVRHPCCADLTYGADPTLAQRLRLTRQWLHAVGLAFDHPVTGDRVQAESGYPADLQQALDIASGSP